MNTKSLSVSVPEAVCANTAMLRNILVHLVRVGALSATELDALFALTKEDLSGGRYDAATVPGAQAYVDCLYQSMGIACVQPESTVKH
jgi:hypothetical protein